MRSLITVLGILIVISGFAQTHDLALTDILAPQGRWIQGGVEAIPRVKIANLGSQHETDVQVFLFIDDKWEDDDTVYAESVAVPYIGAGSPTETVEIDFPAWTPEGICRYWQGGWPGGEPPALEAVGRYYELTARVGLETDENPNNDTLGDTVNVLLSHDVGVVDLKNLEGHEWANTNADPYPAGTVFTCDATVENFGFNEEHDVTVDLEIYDVYKDPDSLVWYNRRLISYLDWRGSDLGNPYIVDVEFPPFTMPEDNCYRLECRTELEGDGCPENDEVTIFINNPEAVGEGIDKPQCFSLEIAGVSTTRNSKVYFEVPLMSRVKIAVYDVNGRRVTSLADDVYKPGFYQRTWDGTDEEERKVAAGIYLVRMEAEGFSDVRKVIIINKKRRIK